MNTSRKAWIACAALAMPVAALVLAAPDSARAQTSSTSASNPGVPITQLIDSVAKKSNKNFIVDPRVAGNALLIGIDPAKVTYAELLTILEVNGFAAIETGTLVRVIPNSIARAEPSPLIGANDKRPDAEVVTRVVKVRSIPAPQLVPILRSLLPQNAHLAAFPCTNEMLIVDTYANVRRIESIIETMDKGDTLSPPKCTAQPPTFAPSPSPATPAPAPKD